MREKLAPRVCRDSASETGEPASTHACGGRLHDGFIMDPTAAVKGEMRFSRKKNQPGGGPPGDAPPDREIPRPPLGPLQPIPARRGLPGRAASARATRGAPQCAFMMDPAPARARKTHFPFSRMQNLQGFGARRGSGREIPHAPQTRPPRLQKYRKRNGRPADQMEGKGGVCDRPDAIVRGPGGLCVCGARVTHAICKRYRRYIPTQPI